MNQRSNARTIPRAMLALSTGAVFLLLVVPYAALDAIRLRLPLVGWASDWLAAAAPTLDLEHLLAFALLGALARLAQSRPRPLVTAILLAAFSTLTELLQYWVPSRSVRVDDLVLNLAGGLLGYALAAGLAGLWRLRRRA